MSTNKTVSLQDLLDDARRVLRVHGKISRELYRKHGTFKESNVYKFFSNFSEFNKTVQDTEKPNASESNEFTADSWNIKLDGTPIHTLEELIEYCKIDLTIWEVERFIVNTWQMGYKDKAGEAQAKSLYQVKAVLLKKKAIIDATKEIAQLKEDLKQNAPFFKTKYPDIELGKSGNMLEISLPDSHFGKMSWSAETGGRSYDTPIAAATFIRALDTLIKRSAGYKFDKVLFVVGNDLLNADNEQGTTTKGTFVATDGRYQKTFLTVRKTIMDSIAKLKKLAPVHVLMVSGNHDDLGVWHLGDSLECAYANDEDVTIDNSPRYRKYMRHGVNFLMFTHGDKGKREDYPLLMATEQSIDFGESLFREVHTGHIHQTKLQEWHGVRVRILPSLSPADTWHSENGFTGQQRNAEAYIWNDKLGLICQLYHNDDALPEITTDRTLKEG